MWCTRCFRTKDFSSPFTPSSSEEEVFDVSSQKRKKKQTKQTKFIIRVTISFKNKTFSSLQSFQAEHKKQLLSLSFQIKFGFFSFFNQPSILGSHWALGAFLPKFCNIHNPTLSASDPTVQRMLGGTQTIPDSTQSQETLVPADRYY